MLSFRISFPFINIFSYILILFRMKLYQKDHGSIKSQPKPQKGMQLIKK